jgi:CRP-like cAMP-binding protein
VEDAVQEACARVYEQSEQDASKQGMGTTLVLLLTIGEAVIIAHVGDSRVYLIRDQQAHQLTQDHSLLASLLIAGKLTKEEAENWPNANVITRCVGTQPTVKVDVLFVECMSHDRFLLCSDGFHQYLRHHNELAFMGAGLPLDDLVMHCIMLANDAGGRDNITVVAVEVGDVQRTGGESGISLSRKIAALRHIPLFSLCDAQQLVKILNLIEVRSYESGQVILAEGTSSDGFFILLSGKVDLLQRGQRLLTLGRGAPFGETALLERTTHTTTVRTSAPTKVMCLHGSAFNALLQQEPELAVNLLRGFVLAMHHRLCLTSSELVEAREAVVSLSPELSAPSETLPCEGMVNLTAHHYTS